jgi:hypothetical protein
MSRGKKKPRIEWAVTPESGLGRASKAKCRAPETDIQINSMK